MDNIILIFVCLIAGISFQKTKIFPANTHLVLNQFLIYIALPAVTLYHIPRVMVSKDLLFPLGVAWLGFLLAFVFFSALGKWLQWPKKLTGCLILTGGLGNTAFIGYPVIEALYGGEGLETAIVLDQAGSFVVMATMGIIVAAVYSGKKEAGGPSYILRKVFSFPPFIAFLTGLCMNIAGLEFSEGVGLALQRLGKTIAPIALFAVGIQLKIDKKSPYWNYLAYGLSYKLMLMPAAVFVLYKLIFTGDNLITDVSVIEAGMAPMITAAILATAYGLKPKLASMMVGVGIPLSFLTIDLWYWLLLSF